MTSSLLRILCIVTLLAPTLSQAQTAAPPPPSLFDKFSSEVRNPVPWFNWGADMRVRNEYFDNIITLTDDNKLHEQDVIRYRGRVWASVMPWEGLSLNTRLSAEPRGFMRRGFPGTYRGQSGMEWRYGIFDVLNLKLTNIFNQPLSLTVGRQDMAFGEYWNWWLVADGTPGDGSWSFFLDAARLTYDAQDIKTRFDAIYLYQSARPDDWLPTLGYSSDFYLTEQDEQGVILYASNKSLKTAQLDGYFIYKKDNPEVLGVGDEANIYTVGGKILGNPWEHWQYALEGAYQFGEKDDPTVKTAHDAGMRDISAFGGNARLSYLFKDPHNNQLHVFYEFLSGDDPDSEGTDEMFDILWGRWPRFSEAYIYSYIAETGGRVAQLNNIQRVGAGWSINPIKAMTFTATYNAWFAPEEVTRPLSPLPGNPGSAFSTGSFRGHYLQTVLKHQFNKHAAGHLWGEFIWPGDYYRDQPFMDFLRAEILLTF